MKCGNLYGEPTLTYPSDCVQSYIDDASWWEKDDGKTLCRGRLVWVFAPHVDQIPMSLVPEGRTVATEHQTANFRIETLRIKDAARTTKLPVAALAHYPGESYTVYRSKKRPALVFSAGGPDIPRELRSSLKPKWQTAPTMLVAPYYGTQAGSRSGWYSEFVDRIRKAEYPQYMWDKLPLAGDTDSILRFDHIQPIGRHHDSYELTEYVLKEDAIELVEEWLFWLMTGNLPDKSALLEIREVLIKL